MSKKSELAAMKYLAAKKPKQYRFTINSTEQLCGGKRFVTVVYLLEERTTEYCSNGTVTIWEEVQRVVLG